VRRVAAALLALVLLAACGGDAPAATGCIRLAVPAYVRPTQLVRAAAGGDTDVIVVNPANGPDVERDDDLAIAVDRVRGDGVTVLGYVATGYGRADAPGVLELAQRYERWYGVDGIFLDEVSSGRDDLGRYRAIIAALRASGVATIALNPGVRPDAGYLALGDIVVTFEGTAREYRDLEVGSELRDVDEWHLVHTADEREARAAIELAARRGVHRVFVTDRPEEADTWNALPPYFDAEVRWARRARCPRSP
jgi:hypothetical protein